MNILLVRTLLIAGLAFLTDVLTKRWAEQTLSYLNPVPVVGDLFRVTLGYNTGVVFGMFRNVGTLITVLTGSIIISLSIWVFRALLRGDLASVFASPAGLVLGGALGNFIDRLPDGRVTDFLDAGIGVARWPTFNGADVCIILGVAWIMLLSFQQRPGTATAVPYSYQKAHDENVTHP